MSALALLATIALVAHGVGAAAAGEPAEVAHGSRSFAASGLRFDYPSDFRIAHDPSPPESWKIEGEEVTLVAYRFASGDTSTPAEHVAQVFRLGKERCDAATATSEAMSAGALQLEGAQCDSPHSVIDMHREAYLLVAPDARWMLSCMELRPHGTTGRGELARLKQQISTTLRWPTP